MSECSSCGTGGCGSHLGVAAAGRGPGPAGLRIARANPEDADILAELVGELADFEHLRHECRMTPEAALAHLIGPKRTASAVIAWLEDAPVGFAVYYPTFSTFAARPGLFLEDLYVRERFRRRGIGRTLLGTIVQMAHGAGAGRLEWTALKWNENARKLYASIGAQEMEQWLLLRMDDKALSEFSCSCGGSSSGCSCGDRGSHHASATE